MLELNGIGFKAGDKIIVESIDARFERGRFNVILGPNGAGKSTLLKIATGLLTPNAGQVLYDGQAIKTFTPEDLARRRAVLSQQVELAFPMTARDVAQMGRYPHYRRKPSPADVGVVDRALALVGMTSHAEQPYGTLSGGERQKIHLARVLAQIWNYDDASQHKFLFLDEPTLNLDIHFQIQLLEIVRGLLRHNCTIVAILHEINTALEYGDCFLLLKGGRVLANADGASGITPALMEEAFQVRVHGVNDPEGGSFWRFRLKEPHAVPGQQRGSE